MTKKQLILFVSVCVCVCVSEWLRTEKSEGEDDGKWNVRKREKSFTRISLSSRTLSDSSFLDTAFCFESMDQRTRSRAG